MRVPRMTTPELLKALAIYHRHVSPKQMTSHATGKTEPQMALKHLMQELFRDDTASQESSES